MLYTQKNTEEYNELAQLAINYVKRSGFEDIRADIEGYESPASLKMVSQELTLTPDFTAKRGSDKYYFELVVKNGAEDEQNMLVSKWKALEMIAKMKGGRLTLLVPRGSYKYASELIEGHGIGAKLTKMGKV